VSGIAPLVDPGNPSAFPLELAFNTPTADFEMQAISVVAPASVSLLIAGMILVWITRKVIGRSVGDAISVR